MFYPILWMYVKKSDKYEYYIFTFHPVLNQCNRFFYNKNHNSLVDV